MANTKKKDKFGKKKKRNRNDEDATSSSNKKTKRRLTQGLTPIAMGPNAIATSLMVNAKKLRMQVRGQ